MSLFGIWLKGAGVTCLLTMTACLAAPGNDELTRMQNQDSKKSTDCPEPALPPTDSGWELGTGTFTAERSGGVVIVRAHGMNPTPNFVVQFIRKADGTMSLYRKRPGGMQMQVLTGFAVCATLKDRGAAESVVIRDRQGEHSVKVVPGNGTGK